MPERITSLSQATRAEARPLWSVWHASLELSRDSFFNGVVGNALKVGRWANDTAMEFGALVSTLLAPAIVSAYLIALWSITSDMGITGQFMVSSGPFSNWIVWMGIAVALHGAASVLSRHGRRD